MVAPYRLGKYRLVHHVSGTHEEIFKDIELLLEKGDILAVDRQTTRRLFEPYISGLQGHFSGIDASTGDTAYACSQLRHMKRLGKIVVGSEFEAGDLVVYGIPCRNDDDIQPCILPLYLRQQVKAASVRKVYVQEDTVIRIAGKLVKRRVAVHRILDHIAFTSEGPGHKLLKGQVIFDDEKLHSRQVLTFKGNHFGGTCYLCEVKTAGRTYMAAGAAALLCVMAAADMLCGGAAASAQVLWHLRAPRVATALLAGAALSLAGAQMQSVLRNPLADPHIMGVSSGASLGAALATMWGGRIGMSGSVMQGISIAGAAFLGALLSAAVILAVSRKFRSASTLLIFGVMLGFIVNALVSILQFSSDAESLKIFYSWSAGSFSNTTWPQISVMAAAIAIGFVIAYRGRKGLDIILFGDEFARMAGAGISGIRLRALLSSCIVTGAVTAFCGPLGFVGIVAPHIARALCRTSAHTIILPASLLTGCIISLAADLLSQLTDTPLPTASTMAIVGIPIILYILIKKPAL